MIKYRIVYIGNDRYLAWDADNKRFVPAYMHLYVNTWDDINDCMAEMKKIKRQYSGWIDDIYIDSVNRDPLGECKPTVKRFF